MESEGFFFISVAIQVKISNNHNSPKMFKYIYILTFSHYGCNVTTCDF